MTSPTVEGTRLLIRTAYRRRFERAVEAGMEEHTFSAVWDGHLWHAPSCHEALSSPRKAFPYELVHDAAPCFTDAALVDEDMSLAHRMHSLHERLLALDEAISFAQSHLADVENPWDALSSLASSVGYLAEVTDEVAALRGDLRPHLTQALQAALARAEDFLRTPELRSALLRHAEEEDRDTAHYVAWPLGEWALMLDLRGISSRSPGWLFVYAWSLAHEGSRHLVAAPEAVRHCLHLWSHTPVSSLTGGAPEHLHSLALSLWEPGSSSALGSADAAFEAAARI